MESRRTHPDLIEAEDAARLLIQGIVNEVGKLGELEQEVQRRSAELAPLGRRYRDIMSDPYADSDDFMSSIGDYWHAYDEASVIERLERSVDELKRAMEVRFGTVTTLASSLLQLGRNLIALNHQRLDSCPPGRRIGSQDLKTVIWEGRNQAAHCGDHDDYRKGVKCCFAALAADNDPAFALGPKPDQNHALRLIKMLGWTDYARFAQDMDSLLPSMNNPERSA